MEENNPENHILKKIWSQYSEFLNDKQQTLTTPPIEKLLGEIFSIGKFYYYTINISDSTLSNHHESILGIHGFKKFPLHLKEILELIHPDDLDFVMAAEEMCLQKMVEINGFAYQQELKTSYCFRMKTAKGNYDLFHHQAIHTLKDENGKLLQAVNIHTNINHINPQNPYTVLVSGIGNRKDFHQMYYNKNNNLTKDHLTKDHLTKREMEILGYIAKGYSASQISNLLNISFYTARTHRKNIMRKTDSKNTLDLLKKCFQWGYI